MPARTIPVYMIDAAWDHVDSLRKDDPRKGRGAVISEIILADKERREKAEKQKAADKQPAA